MTLVCCSPKQEQSVPLFNNISFKLKNNEKVVNIDNDKKDIFKSYFNGESIQIPLYRCIKSDNYLIFIAIPFNTSVKELADYGLTQTLNQTFYDGDSTTYFYKKYSTEKEHITIYAKNFSNNLVYVLTTSGSAELSDSLFNIEAISNRFKN